MLCIVFLGKGEGGANAPCAPPATPLFCDLHTEWYTLSTTLKVAHVQYLHRIISNESECIYLRHLIPDEDLF